MNESSSADNRSVMHVAFGWQWGISNANVWCFVCGINIRDAGAGSLPTSKFVRLNSSIFSLVSDL